MMVWRDMKMTASSTSRNGLLQSETRVYSQALKVGMARDGNSVCSRCSLNPNVALFDPEVSTVG